MQNDKIDRKQFLTLTLAVAGGALLGCASGETGKSTGAAGSGGAGSGGGAGTSGAAGAGGGTAGTSGAAGNGAAGTSGAAGAGGGAGTSGTAGAGGSGGATGAAGTGGAAANCGTSLKITITNNHGHVLTVTVADITADKTKTYSTRGAADHDHFIRLTAADFTALAGGKELRKPSCNGDHEHEFIVNCVGTEGVSNPNVGGYCGSKGDPNRDCGLTMTTTCPDTPYPTN